MRERQRLEEVIAAHNQSDEDDDLDAKLFLEFPNWFYRDRKLGVLKCFYSHDDLLEEMDEPPEDPVADYDPINKAAA